LKPALVLAPLRARGAISSRADTTSLSLIVGILSRRTQGAFPKAGYVPNLASRKMPLGAMVYANPPVNG
jgi:hypothetical protein